MDLLKKSIIRYFVLLIIFTGLIIGVHTIPQSAIKDNVITSTHTLEKEGIDIKEKEPLDVYIFGASKEEKKYILSLGNTLRMNGFNVEIDYNNKSFKSNFKKADSLLAKYIIIIGEEEVKSKILTVKNNKTKEEYKVKLDNLIEFLDEKLGDDDED